MDAATDSLDNDGNEIVAPPTPPAPAPTRRGPVRKAPVEPADRETRNMMDWLHNGIGSASDYKLSLYRMEPEFYLGKRIKGHLETFESKIDETQVKAMYGGGRYKLQLMMPTPTGDYRIAGSHTFDISGDPKVGSLEGMAPPAATPREDSTVVTKAMEVMASQVARAEDRANRGPGIDADAIARAVQMATQPMQSTIDMLTRELAAARQAATEARNAPPDPVRDRILEKVMSDDSSRMESLRIAHTAEVSTLRQSMADLESRLRDKHDRELADIRSDHKTERERADRQHEREVAEIKRSYDTQLQILRDAHTREVNSLTMVSTTTKTIGESESRRMERENAELRAEVKTLREKKDKPLLEQIKEMDELKDILGGDGEEKKGWEKALEVVANAKPVANILGKLAGGDQPQQQMPPPHVPFVGQDGQTYVHDGQGNVQLIPARPRQRLKQAPRRPQPPPPPPPAPPADAPPEVQAQHAQQVEQHAKIVKEQQVQAAIGTIDRDQVALAVTYLENAYRGGQDPQTVASSLRSQALVPGPVLQFLRDQGVDVLLEKVARLEASSPFASQAGRNWIRKVAKALTEP